MEHGHDRREGSDGGRDGRRRTGRRRFLELIGGGMVSTGFSSTANAGPLEATDSVKPDDVGQVTVTSPDGNVAVTVTTGAVTSGDVNDVQRAGKVTYSVSYDGTEIVSPSALGFEFREHPPINRNLEVVDVSRRPVDRTWEPVWGATAEVRNHYNELSLTLEETVVPGRRIGLVFRVFDDGVGFRYRFPDRAAFDSFEITAERTEFRFTDDHTAWWIPGDPDNYEYLYNETPLSQMPSTPTSYTPINAASGEPAGGTTRTANTPVTLRTEGDDELYVAIHEAALTDFAGMRVTNVESIGPHSLQAKLVPFPLEKVEGVPVSPPRQTKVRTSAPRVTPWRTLQIGTSPGDLIESKLILNLNQPCALEDTDWIDPGKYVGIWWEIHTGKSTWAPGPDVGATTANAKRYIDFASEHDIPMLLAEGWNVGWGEGADWDDQNFTTSTEYFDLEEVVEYGKEHGVGFLAHTENGGAVENYIEQLDEAFALYEDLGLPGVKTGYAGDIAEHHHHDQWMVNHYRDVIRKAADHELMINAHEPIKPTGLRRTYPNFMTREGVRGMEYNAWSTGNPSTHTVTLPFTRMLAGPLDYTPGIFEIDFENDNPFLPVNLPGNRRVHTTRAHQLALYPILFSGLQMAADLPGNYRGEPAFEFIEHVPADWDETRVLDAEIGSYVAVARRSGEEWYIGTATDDQPRVVDVPLEFLDDDRPFVAHIYADAPQTDLEDNPTPVSISRRTVTTADTIQADMAAGGGQAVRLVPADNRSDRSGSRGLEPRRDRH